MSKKIKIKNKTAEQLAKETETCPAEIYVKNWSCPGYDGKACDDVPCWKEYLQSLREK